MFKTLSHIALLNCHIALLSCADVAVKVLAMDRLQGWLCEEEVKDCPVQWTHQRTQLSLSAKMVVPQRKKTGQSTGEWKGKKDQEKAEQTSKSEKEIAEVP